MPQLISHADEGGARNIDTGDWQGVPGGLFPTRNEEGTGRRGPPDKRPGSGGQYIYTHPVSLNPVILFFSLREPLTSSPETCSLVRLLTVTRYILKANRSPFMSSRVCPDCGSSDYLDPLGKRLCIYCSTTYYTKKGA